ILVKFGVILVQSSLCFVLLQDMLRRRRRMQQTNVNPIVAFSCSRQQRGFIEFELNKATWIWVSLQVWQNWKDSDWFEFGIIWMNRVRPSIDLRLLWRMSLDSLGSILPSM